MTDVLLSSQAVRYRMYDFRSMTLVSELPLHGVSFGQRLNTAGSFSGTMVLSAPNLRALAPLTATQPGRTLCVVDINGTIVWGGVIWTRQYQKSTRSVQIGGQEAYSYFARRVQAKDYSTTFASPTDACVIAKTVIQDAIAVPYSALSNMTVQIVYQTPTSSSNYIVAAYPITQLQTIDQIVGTLSQMGYGVGFDFTISWAYNGSGIPTPTFTIWYPRSGAEYSSSSQLLDAGKQDQDYTWPEDATGQANKIYGTANQGSGTADTAVIDPGSLNAGYPLLEQVNNYTQVNTGSELNALSAGSLATITQPIATPVVTVDPFGPFALGSFALGDDVRCYVGPEADIPGLWGVVGDETDERWPGGTAGQY